MSSKLPVVAIALSVLVLIGAGCAYMERESQRTSNDLRAAVPTMRVYALEHLSDLSTQDRSIIADTEPKILHANYSIFYYSWTGVCEVVSLRPPSQPYNVIDRRGQK